MLKKKSLITAIEQEEKKSYVGNRFGFSDILNFDEPELTPDKTLKFKEVKCVGRKLSKERITVFVTANMDGIEKRKLMVIG